MKENRMKEYKLIDTSVTRSKAISLGYHINIEIGGTYLFLHATGASCSSKDYTHYSGYTSQTEFFDKSPFKYLSQKDFLALPTPLIVGDWVKFTNCDGVIIFQITSIGKYFVRSIVMGEEGGYCIDKCTKLTPKQIILLELE